MSADLRYCATLVQCFEQFSNWPMIGEDGRLQLVKHLAATARDDDEAHAAIQALLSDAARASSPSTNRVPTMGELTQWLVSQRQDQYDTPPPASGNGGCGRIFDGWTYDDDNGRHQSACGGGWVRRTIYKQRGNMVNEDGSPLRQPYQFAGKCKCVGGWL